MRTMPILLATALMMVCANACDRSDMPVGSNDNNSLMTKREVARMLSCLPIGEDQMDEVFDAVNSSSANGYDEEYMMADLLTSPGSGVGDDRSKAGGTKAYSTPMRSLIANYLSTKVKASTKAGAADVQRYLDDLRDSGMQIYWPYSEFWDGETLPLITFDPGDGSESNYAYVIVEGNDGYVVADSVFVNEAVAMERPVWVINQNDDSGSIPLSSLLSTKSVMPDQIGHPVTLSESEDEQYNLYIRDFTMLRQYDNWFAGASEFHVWTGGVDSFYATTEEELRNYSPSVTDFVVVVRRNEVGKRQCFNALLISEFTDQLEKLAFLIVEDDGGTRTSWKCAASVKIKSKTYGFDIEIPFNSHDDVVWRGELGASYFKKGKSIEGRFGDVKVTFALE